MWVNDSNITNIQEKNKISDNANTGAYGFTDINILYHYCKHVLDNNIYKNTNLIINWINHKEYPVENNNDIFSIKCFTKAGLFAIFDTIDIFD